MEEDELEQRKLLIQNCIERILSKYEKSEEFKTELKELFKKYPLTTEVVINPIYEKQNEQS